MASLLDRSLLARLHADLGDILNGTTSALPVNNSNNNNDEKMTQEKRDERLRKLRTTTTTSQDAVSGNSNSSETKPSIIDSSSSKPKRSVAEIDADLRTLLSAYGTTSACALEAYMAVFRTEASRLLEERRVSV